MHIFREFPRIKINKHLFEPFCVWILEVTSLPVRCSMDTDVPFSRWDGDRVTAWMNEIGLNMYLGECKRWVRNGEQLLKASVHDLEKVRCLWTAGGVSIALEPGVCRMQHCAGTRCRVCTSFNVTTLAFDSSRAKRTCCLPLMSNTVMLSVCKTLVCPQVKLLYTVKYE